LNLLKALLDTRLALRLFEVFDRRTENRTTEFGMLAQAFEFIKINGIGGDYFEFGVWRGKTFGYARTMARRYRVANVKFRAFDSFRGLPAIPPSDYEIWQQGQFACARDEFEAILARKGFRPGEYVLTEGLYSEMLKDDLVTELKREGVQVAIAYIDCDLYESCRDVLNFVAALLQDGSVLCFDDYWHYRGRSDMGEQRAIAEFAIAHPNISLRPFMPYSPLGMSFVCELGGS
jgi:O-methyltransferase